MDAVSVSGVAQLPVDASSDASRDFDHASDAVVDGYRCLVAASRRDRDLPVDERSRRMREFWSRLMAAVEDVDLGQIQFAAEQVAAERGMFVSVSSSSAVGHAIVAKFTDRGGRSGRSVAINPALVLVDLYEPDGVVRDQLLESFRASLDGVTTTPGEPS